jgi:DUF4097 and DUF4098 domain-containing protein YvlB
MPTFDTPEPIFALIEMETGRLRIVASDRADTVVSISPHDQSDSLDVQVAAETTVGFVNGRLQVRTPKRKVLSLIGRYGSIDVQVELPSGSRVEARAMTDIVALGPLGDAKFRSGAGSVEVERTGRLDLSTSMGDISVGHCAGHAEIKTANGSIRLDEIDGSAVVSTANGSVTIGEVGGDLRIKTANGSISVDRALADVEATTAAGGVRVGEIVRGVVALRTGYGRLELGVGEGTAANLDVHTRTGLVRCELDSVDAPEPSDQTVEVRARTEYGDILIHRSRPAGRAL